MSRRRPLIVALCLLAMIFCQAAMAAQSCVSAFAAPDAVTTHCHGGDDAKQSDDSGGSCKDCRTLPDFGKLPTILPLLLGHDFVAGEIHRQLPTIRDCPTAAARAGPSLNALCRLLI